MKKLALILAVAVACILATWGVSHASYSGYTYQRTITIPYTQVSTQTLTLTNFPVLFSIIDVTLSTASSGGHLANSSAFDILFSTKSDCSLGVNFDTETINNTGTAQLNVWVQVPSISSNTNTTLYMCYGNSGITSYNGHSTAVWNSNYGLVYHLNDNAANTTIKDSTSNGNNGTDHANTSGQTTTGQIDGALSLPSYAGNDIVSNSNITSNGNWTMEGWIYQTTTNAYSAWLGQNIGSGNSIFIGVNGGGSHWYVLGGGIGGDTSVAIPGLSTWTQAVVTYNSGTLTLYVNGANVWSATGGSNLSNAIMAINSGNDANTVSTMDEVRFLTTALSPGWIQTEYNNQGAPGIFSTVGPETTSGATVTCPTGYSYYRQALVQNPSGSTFSNNFPVLLSTAIASSFATSGNGGKLQNASGYDLIITTATDGSSYVLNFETESYTASNGTIVYWVKVATLTVGDQTALYAYYDNSSISTFQGGAVGSAWDSYYVGVWHLPNGTTLTSRDSTSNNNNGTLTGSPNPSATTGQIDGGASFTGSNSEIDIANSSSLNIVGNLTLEVWVKPTENGNYQTLITRTNGTRIYSYYLISGGAGIYAVGSGGAVAYSISPGWTSGAWNHIVMTVTGGESGYFYINGTQAGMYASGGGSSATSDVYLGYDAQAGNYVLDGVLDEARISNIARSADWITAEYNNQKTGSTMVTWGAETSCGGAAPAVTNPRRVIQTYE